jgi:hypothetical protein
VPDSICCIIFRTAPPKVAGSVIVFVPVIVTALLASDWRTDKRLKDQAVDKLFLFPVALPDANPPIAALAFGFQAWIISPFTRRNFIRA